MSESLVSSATVGRYQLGQLLGRGGMGVVYEAFDPLLGRKVALKLLDPNLTRDPRRVERFQIEARAASLLTHPCIITVHDVGQATVRDQAVHYIAMELVTGQRLANWLAVGPALQNVLSLVALVAEGVAQAHARGVVHRDLKPDNIMVTEEGLPKILDFGIAKLIDAAPERSDAVCPAETSLTLPETILGTVGYMSPEQVEGLAADHRADIFSLGCVLYVCLTGRAPFVGTTQAERLHATVHGTPLPLSLEDGRVEAALQRILDRALAKDAARRYDSARDLALDLREAQSLIGTSVPQVRPQRSSRSRRLGRFVAIGLALAAAVIVTTDPGREELGNLLPDSERAALLSQSLATERENNRRLSAELVRLNSDRENAERLRAQIEQSYRDLLTEVREHVRTNESERSKLASRLSRADSELRSYRTQQERRQKLERLATIQNHLASTTGARMNGERLALTLPGTLFREGRSEIRSEALPLLEYLAAQVRGGDDIRIIIEGHTDSSGDADKNLALSQARAEGVRSALAASGVPVERISAVGRGESFPAYDNSSHLGRISNRRVNLIVYYEGLTPDSPSPNPNPHVIGSSQRVIRKAAEEL